jgi:hypothetical protein
MIRFTYIIPGILTELEDARTWDYRAQAWLYRNGFGLAAGFNYHAGVIGGSASLDRYAGVVASDLMAAAVAGFTPIVAAGHSNGCRILVRSLAEDAGVRIDTLHLVAAAVDRDCEASGLNSIARREQVKRIVLYVSPDDTALGFGPLFGYGNLGKLGPLNPSPELLRILERVDGHCDHSDWVVRDFEQTIQRIAAAMPLVPPAVV